MPDIRDELLNLDRDGLEVKAKQLGLEVTSSMSRAELITLIEQHYAMEEFGELRSFSEHRFLIIGLFLITLATFILALHTLFHILIPQGNPFAVITIPFYIIMRGLGGFFIAAALFSLGLKTGYRTITPIMRASFILGAVLIILIVLILMPLPPQW